MIQDQHKPQTSEDRPVVIGIDWADGQHDVCVIEDGSPDLGPAQFSELRQHPDAMADFIADLRGRFPGRPLQVVIEQSRGALVNALLESGPVELFPINPKQLARYRDALYPSGGKDDPVDAELAARFLIHHRDRLRPWRPDSEQTRRIATHGVFVMDPFPFSTLKPSLTSTETISHWLRSWSSSGASSSTTANAWCRSSAAR